MFSLCDITFVVVFSGYENRTIYPVDVSGAGGCTAKVQDNGKAEWMRGHVKNRLFDISAEYKNFMADANERIDEHDIGDDW